MPVDYLLHENIIMDRLQTLFSLYLQSRASDAEVTEMLSLMRVEPAENVKEILAVCLTDPPDIITEPVDWNAMWAVIEEKMERTPRLATVKTMQPAKRWWALAGIFLFMAGIGYWLIDQLDETASVATKNITTVKADVKPGITGAVLTLPDGKIIVLDTASNGVIAENGSGSIIKGSDGVSVAPGRNNTATTEYATLTTPFGRTQDVTLSDGSRVWLNAGSSIYFPVVFSGKERKVVITGEVYFEVAENKARPFRVQVGDASAQVLGTSFNINAYPDEKLVRTTLLTGSLRMTKGSSSGLLIPGQQASFTPHSNDVRVIADPHAANAIAWVNGFFHFDKADIHTVMRQIARWYDVEIEYKGQPTTDRFGGDIQRNLPLSSVLKALEKSQVHFKIENKKIVVMP